MSIEYSYILYRLYQISIEEAQNSTSICIIIPKVRHHSRKELNINMNKMSF